MLFRPKRELLEGSKSSRGLAWYLLPPLFAALKCGASAVITALAPHLSISRYLKNTELSIPG